MRNFAFIFVLFGMLSCTSNNKSYQDTREIQEIAIDNEFSGSCPYLFTSGDSLRVISWVRTVSETKSMVCLKIEDENGFGETIVVPGSEQVKPHAENMPKVAVGANGRIVVAWGIANPSPDNKYSALVLYSSSIDHGKTWATPSAISNDKKSTDQRYFDLAVLSNGTIGAIWLDNRKGTEKDGSSLYFATFSDERRFINEQPIDQTVCQCCRTDLFVDRSGGLHVAYRKILNDSIRDIVYTASVDNGKTFLAPKRISQDNWVINGCPHTGPTIGETNLGLSFAWYTLGSGQGVFFASSDDGGNTFTPKNSIGDKAAGIHPQILSLNNKTQMIVWDEHIDGGNRVGFQTRSSNGIIQKTGYLNSKLKWASYPVLQLLNHKLSIAYTGRTATGDSEKVYVQTIQLDELVAD